MKGENLLEIKYNYLNESSDVLPMTPPKQNNFEIVNDIMKLNAIKLTVD